MDDRNDDFPALHGFPAALSNVALAVAEKFGISFEEATSRISNLMGGIQQRIEDLVLELEEIFQELEKSGILNIGTRARWKKQERDRARMIEQRYMVQIRHYERSRPFQRIYKPP